MCGSRMAFPRVCAQVRGEAALLRERLCAYVAVVRLLPGVGAHWVVRLALHIKLLCAYVAGVGL